MGDADRAIDELLNLAVGEDLFAKSVFIEDKLTASQHLRNFDSKQDQILKQCQERHLNEQRQQEQRRAEEQRRQEEENQRIIAEEQKRKIREREKMMILEKQRAEEELLQRVALERE